LAAASVSILGLLVTVWLLPETMGRSLEELSSPEQGAAAASLVLDQGRRAGD
jgi:hypothetical protein